MINRITDNQFKLVSKYQPSGDQPQAIEQLVDNIEGGEKAQILMGATGTGKTYTMSQVISKVNKPTLVIAHKDLGFFSTLDIVNQLLNRLGLIS